VRKLRLRVEKALKKVDGVLEANVNLRNGKSLGGRLTKRRRNLQVLSTAVTEAGYTLLLPELDATESGKPEISDVSGDSHSTQGLRTLRKNLFSARCLPCRL